MLSSMISDNKMDRIFIII